MAGPWICVLGGVVTDKAIVQRLTDFKWTALSSTQEESRVTDMARLFVALRESLNELEGFYKNLAVVDSPPLLSHIPHARFFPYPTFYTGTDGVKVNFQYIIALESDSTCITFVARTTDKKAEDIVIKFVTRYGWKVHEHLARKGKAPKLRYVGPLSGASDLRDNKKQASDEYRRGLRMVVMDLVEMHAGPPSDALEQIEEILVDLHSEGYVFGDLRESNILSDEEGRVLLIDFNWCGRYNTRMLEGIPEGPKKQIEQGLAKIQDIEGNGEEYVKYPLSISEVQEIWVDGVEPLKEILPKHDWAMKNKLVL